MRLKIILLCIGLLLNLSACGDKGGASPDDTILVVRALDGGRGGDERLQVALLDADNIRSESDAQTAAEQARWIPIDRFSSDSLVFTETDDNESLFASASSSGYGNHDRHSRYRHGRYDRHDRRYRRHHRRWRPYRHDRWAQGRHVRWRCRGCTYGYLRYRRRCVRPFTPVHVYYWYPRYEYARADIRIIFYW